MSNSTRSRQLHERGRAGIPKLIERLFAIEGPCARAIFLYCDKWDIEIADVVALMPGRLKARCVIEVVDGMPHQRVYARPRPSHDLEAQEEHQYYRDLAHGFGHATRRRVTLIDPPIPMVVHED